mmetsp:Transcript_32615/g.53685  ORF Transcript_32615/g.53685 Transcript_32615/m.53685 type:complete len:99 (+) Transcript_32615:83-379(+)
MVRVASPVHCQVTDHSPPAPSLRRQTYRRSQATRSRAAKLRRYAAPALANIETSWVLRSFLDPPLARALLPPPQVIACTPALVKMMRHLRFSYVDFPC